MTSERRLTTERDVRSDDGASAATATDDGAVRPEPELPEEDLDGAPEQAGAVRSRASIPLVPALVVLLVLLLAGLGYLWLTRPAKSAVTTADYVEALQAARSAVVDLTSFDYLTLDDDIEQIRRITTGDLREEAVGQLDDSRQTITDSEATVNTEIVAAAVTAVDADDATVLLVIQSAQENNQSDQAQVTKYRVQATLQKVDGRWLLSGISGR